MTKKSKKDPPEDPFRPPVRIGKPHVHRPKKASLNDDISEMEPPKTKYKKGSDEVHKRLGL